MTSTPFSSTSTPRTSCSVSMASSSSLSRSRSGGVRRPLRVVRVGDGEFDESVAHIPTLKATLASEDLSETWEGDFFVKHLSGEPADEHGGTTRRLFLEEVTLAFAAAGVRCSFAVTWTGEVAKVRPRTDAHMGGGYMMLDMLRENGRGLEKLSAGLLEAGVKGNGAFYAEPDFAFFQRDGMVPDFDEPILVGEIGWSQSMEDMINKMHSYFDHLPQVSFGFFSWLPSLTLLPLIQLQTVLLLKLPFDHALYPSLSDPDTSSPFKPTPSDPPSSSAPNLSTRTYEFKSFCRSGSTSLAVEIPSFSFTCTPSTKPSELPPLSLPPTAWTTLLTVEAADDAQLMSRFSEKAITIDPQTFMERIRDLDKLCAKTVDKARKEKSARDVQKAKDASEGAAEGDPTYVPEGGAAGMRQKRASSPDLVKEETPKRTREAEDTEGVELEEKQGCVGSDEA
ncbi:hypothetical protein JCM8097_004423 [Rhodosporidiobolus ruineniae]